MQSTNCLNVTWSDALSLHLKMSVHMGGFSCLPLMCLQCGYWKDLLELLDRLCVGEEEWAARIEALKKRVKGANHESRKAAKKERLKEWRTALRSIKDAEGRDAAKVERAAGNAGNPDAHACLRPVQIS